MLFREGGYAWWVSRDSTKMTYWGGASPGSGKCACGIIVMRMTMFGVKTAVFLTDKTELPVKQLRFGDTVHENEKGYHTLENFKCYGIAH